MKRRETIQRLGRLLITTLLIFSCTSSTQAKRDDDVVVLKNGDHLTGEIKGLFRGELRFKSSYMVDAVRLDWEKVERLESKSAFLIYLTDGQLFTGSLRVGPVPGIGSNNFIIEFQKNSMVVKQLDVIKITPVEAGFWRQLEGSVDFGFSFTSGNNQYQTELAATTTYRRGDQSMTLSVDSVFSGQPKGTSTARKELTFDYRKQLNPKYYVGGLLDFLSSDQQSLDLRTTVGGLIGRNLIQSEHTRFSIFGGLAASREKYSAEVNQARNNNVDALTGFDFFTFRFKTTDIRSRLLLFPSLTTPGRMRMQATSDLKIEIAKDLYWGFHVYENFDSKPPLLFTKKNDLGISTSVGWKF